MPFTAADLDALDTALKTGVLEVRFQDRTVTYQSTDSMLKVRGLIIADIHPPGTSPPISRIVRCRGDKGL